MASNIFKKVSIDVPNRSGFDMSHENLFSSSCGTLTPVMIDTLLPNDTVNLSAVANVQLPPFASDFYGRIELKFECFFVPFRILYGGWKEFITIPLDFVQGTRPEAPTSSGAGNTYGATSSVYLPKASLTSASSTNWTTSNVKAVDWFGPGSLADYLGYGVDPTNLTTGTTFEIGLLPFLAYHKIWEDWYRDSRLSNPAFTKVQMQTTLNANPSNNATPLSVAQLPYITRFVGSSPTSSTVQNLTLADNKGVFQLRQRSFAKDYFTAATPLPQSGNSQSVSFDTSGATGAFSIASLRAANAIQQWLERNNLAGNRYGDQINANFGIYPADAVTDRCLYLGRLNVPVYAKSVYQTTNDTSQSFQNNNPLASSVGASYGSPQGVKGGSLIRDGRFTASEHGFLFVMASLVPSAYYSSGIRKYLRHNNITEFGWPMLQGVGDQAILIDELSDDPTQVANVSAFGYTQKYSEYKFYPDEVHGLLKDGQSLESFALQRSFTSGSGGNVSGISTSFCEIPVSFLNQVGAVSNSQSDYGYWCDCYFKYHKVSTLAAYSIPTLSEMKNVHKETINLGGSRL